MFTKLFKGTRWWLYYYNYDLWWHFVLVVSRQWMWIHLYNLIITLTSRVVLAGCWLTLQAQSKKVSLLYTNAETSHKSLFASQYRHWLSILRRKNRSFNKRKQIQSLSVFKAINSSKFLFLDWSDLLLTQGWLLFNI